MTPSVSEEINGAWPFSTVKRPFEPGSSTWLALVCRIVFSGERMFSDIMSSLTISTVCCNCCRGRCKDLLALLYCFLNCSDIQEGLFRDVIYFSVEYHLESEDGIFD